MHSGLEVKSEFDALKTRLYSISRMKLTNLIRHLGDQLNIPIEELQNFDIQHFVEDSLKAAGGELKKLSRSTNNKTLVQQEKPPALAFGGDDEDFINYTSGRVLFIPSHRILLF